jgi:outer membrane protein assembly factor BamB
MSGVRSSAGICAVALAAAACGCATESARGAGDAGEVGAALARLHASGPGPINAAGAPMVYLAYRGPAGSAIGAFDLAHGSLVWHQPAEPTGRIEVGRSAIVHATRTPAGGAVLVGRNAASGDVIWRQELPGDQRLHGYALDGETCFYVVRAFSQTGTHGAGRLIALDARTGATRWQHTLPRRAAGWWRCRSRPST